MTVRGRPSRLHGLATALQRGFAKDVPAYADAPAGSFVVYAQNHDQVANRRGARPVAERGSWDAARLAAAVVLHAPDLPLLFMGEEWGETAPFPFFTDFTEPELAAKVRAGRRRALRRLGASADVPDPAADATFAAARPDPATGHTEGGGVLDLGQAHAALHLPQGLVLVLGEPEGHRLDNAADVVGAVDEQRRHQLHVVRAAHHRLHHVANRAEVLEIFCQYDFDRRRHRYLTSSPCRGAAQYCGLA